MKGWLNKKFWVYSYSEILFTSLQKEMMYWHIQQYINLGNSMLSERTQTCNVTNYMISLIGNIQNRAIHTAYRLMVALCGDQGNKEVIIWKVLTFLSAQWKCLGMKPKWWLYNTVINVLSSTELLTSKQLILWMWILSNFSKIYNLNISLGEKNLTHKEAGENRCRVTDWSTDLGTHPLQEVIMKSKRPLTKGRGTPKTLELFS